jgi:hypothetical protein
MLNPLPCRFNGTQRLIAPRPGIEALKFGKFFLSVWRKALCGCQLEHLAALKCAQVERFLSAPAGVFNQVFKELRLPKWQSDD